MIPVLSIIVSAVGTVTFMVIVDSMFNTYENFGTLPPMTTKVNREIQTSDGTSYAVNGNYQSSLSPRFVNANVGANIRYHLPPSGMMAAPSVPTTYSTKVYDEQRPQVIDPGYNANGHSSSKYSRPASSEQVQKMRQVQQQYLDVSDMLPVQNHYSSSGYSSSQNGSQQMRSEIVNNTLNMQGNDIIQKLKPDEQPIIYDRYIFANSKSRLRGRADPFRGDLPIAPVLPQAAPDSGVWFRPSVTPHIDLSRGYLSVAGGFDNESNNKLQSLMVASSGGTLQSFGGNNIPLQRSLVNNSAGDLLVTAFV